MEPSSTNTTADTDKIGIGLDSCLIPLRHNLFLIQSVDFFYPLIDDPYVMGKITCANVLSDVYASGVTVIDSLIMIMSVCDQMTDEERDAILPLVIKGFQDSAQSVGLTIKIQNIVINPWLMIGGIATSICNETEYINPLNAQIGDVLILTKPLGAQIACNANRWSENAERWDKISKVVTLNQVKSAYEHAIASMARLNKNAAVLMHKYDAHCSTDVTGFGILGHADNLARHQRNAVSFVINTLPVIKNVLPIAEVTGSKEKFLKGFTPETSGGLLISIKEDVAQSYCSDIKEIDGWDAWIVGKVEKGERNATIVENPTIIEVECSL